MRPLLCLGLFAALAFVPSAASATPPAPPSTAPSDAAQANDFNAAMYGSLRDAKGNLFFSAPSLRQALGIAYLGAKGDTAKQMASAIHLDADPNKASAFAKSETNDYQAAKGSATLDVANRLWTDKGLTLKPDFARLALAGYGSPTDPVDFSGHPNDARKTINLWVSKQTHDKINDLIPEPAITSDTRLVITNAIFFKGNWAHAFDKKATQDEAFLADGTSSVKVPMMHQTASFAFAAADGAKILELPYEKSDLAMDVILPDDANGLKAVEDKIVQGKLSTWTSGMHSRKVVVSFPKTKIEWGGSVVPQLEKMGMTNAFNGAADFTNIASPAAAGGNLYISDVIHKAFVAVDEQGTEAAAATAVIITRETAVSVEPPPVVFKADHPFVFAIRDTKTGRVLFMGRVTNPKA